VARREGYCRPQFDQQERHVYIFWGCWWGEAFIFSNTLNNKSSF
jgi:hypothetical protein